MADPHRRRWAACAAGLLAGLAPRPAVPADETDAGIRRAAEAIHQEPLIGADRTRVYAVFTDAVQFERLTRLSAAAQSMGAARKPAAIDAQPGGAFELFGGYVSGRFIELVPGERIVQAWRAGSWAPGSFSIARFEFVQEGSGTRIAFDHAGFPAGQAEHLAQGWHINYWQPLARLLA
jgi:activator of HSP90 ATPase